jgi:hypothetical protein
MILCGMLSNVMVLPSESLISPATFTAVLHDGAVNSIRIKGTISPITLFKFMVVSNSSLIKRH